LGGDIVQDQLDLVLEWFAGADFGFCAHLLLFVPALLLVRWTRRRYGKAVNHYLQVPSRSGLSGLLVARRLLEQAGVRGVRISLSHGFWRTNHYHPLNREIVLSNGVYAGGSVSALSVAAHEVGHAVQYARGYRLAWLRLILVPVTRTCFVLGLAVLLLGLVQGSTQLAWTGVGLFAGCILFPLVTLPVELDASARARDLLVAAGIVQPDEQHGVDDVLRGAALTYAAWAIQAAWCLLVVATYFWLWPPLQASGPLGGMQMWMATDSPLTWTATDIPLLVLLYLMLNRKRLRTKSAPSASEWTDTANLLLQEDELGEAIAAFNMAIRLDPHLARAYANRAVAYARAGRLDDALVDADKAIRLTPDKAEPRACRGYVRMLRKEYDAARADYDEAARLAPENLPLYKFSQADIWMTRGEHDRAIRAYTEAANDAGYRGIALCNRGFAWMSKGDLDRALADLDEAITLGPGEAIAYNNRGVVYTKRGDYQRALADLQTAIQLNPQHPNAYKNLAWIQATCPDDSLRDGAQALANITRARQLARDTADAWLDILAAAHAETGNFAEAVRCQERWLAQASPAPQADQQARLQLYRAGQPFRDQTAMARAAEPEGRLEQYVSS
jgi:Zn-dependent membrane protease YugP/Flp pilus assembly protein TadD